MTQLQSAVVLITGATGGFGQELTRQLLGKGSRLILTDRPAANVAARSQAILQEYNGNQAGSFSKVGEILACFDVDLATNAGCEALYAATQQLATPIDVLINNAGMAVAGAMADIPPEQWEQLMELNLLTPMRLSTRYGADMMARRRRGHIVNMSSLAGWIALPGITAYAASKFGLRGFGEGLRQELVPYNVQVTTVYPFFSRTPILESPRFGALAEKADPLPQRLITDPARIISRTIGAIERNQAEVFPDGVAAWSHRFKRYWPGLIDRIGRQLVKL
jgi:short-subunit dehydrogenase